jgi:HEAT repeat protein
LGDSQATGALVEALGDDSYDVREEAAYALGNIGDPEAEPALTATVRRDRYGPRRAAVEALGRIGTEGAVQTLAKALAADDEVIRLASAIALAETMRPEVGDILAERFNDEASSVVRAHIGQSLGRLGDSRAASRLAEVLRSGPSEPRRLSAEALGQLGGEESEQALRAAMSDPDTSVQHAVEAALADTGSGSPG